MRLTGGMNADDHHCADMVAASDRDRWLTCLYAPGRLRPALMALYALDLEMMSVVGSTTDPMIGQIRLAWWRERLQGLEAGQSPEQPVLRALAAHVVPRALSATALEGLEDAALALLDDDLTTHVRLRGTTLFPAVQTLLSGEAPAAELAGQVAACGHLWAAVDRLRSGDEAARPFAEKLATDSRRQAPVGMARPLFALAALARGDLTRKTPPRPGQPDGSALAPGRQLRILWSILAGR